MSRETNQMGSKNLKGQTHDNFDWETNRETNQKSLERYDLSPETYGLDGETNHISRETFDLSHETYERWCWRDTVVRGASK
jgi:hypothetical protein